MDSRRIPHSGPDSGARKRILFATIAAGGSHVSTARAMQEAVTRHHGADFEAEVREPMLDYGFGRLDAAHKRAWRRALANPWSIVSGQRLIDAFPRVTVGFHRLLLGPFARRAAERLSSERRDLVVVNHGWLTVALTQAQRRFGLDLPVVTFETSTLNANALWADRHAERFIVASDVSKRRLAGLGVPEGRIDVVGYPVRQAFLEAPGKGAARRRLGLEDRFTCLVAMGGEGVGGSPREIVEALLQVRPALQVVAVAGRNEELRRSLEAVAAAAGNLRVLGFVDEVAAYVAASDVVVAKTGPATVYETLAVGRPILAPARFGTAENVLIDLLSQRGMGGYFPQSGDLRREVERLRSSPELLEEVEARARGFDFAGMAERLARYLSHYAATRQVPSDACGRGLDFSG